jgi:hypothetical protein
MAWSSKEKANAYRRERRRNNPDKVRAANNAYRRKWRINNLEEVRASDAAYKRKQRLDNPDKVRQAVREMKARNPEKYRIALNKRQQTFRELHRDDPKFRETKRASSRIQKAAKHARSLSLAIQSLETLAQASGI